VLLLTLLTPTRNRAACFGRLEKYIGRCLDGFSGEVQWLVANDGTEVYRYSLGQTVVARDPSGDRLPSICENYLALLPLIRGDRVLCIEDDDWYSCSPNYLAVMASALDRAELVGSCPAKYYNVATHQWRIMPNTAHASLAQTGFRPSVLPFFVLGCQLGPFIDSVLWCHWAMTLGRSSLLLANDGLHVGLKGQAGEKGSGSGHVDQLGELDADGAVLREWIGADAADYWSIQSGR